jgi:hypothetical protein
MANKRLKPEEIVVKPWQVEVVVRKRLPPRVLWVE